MPGVDGFGSGGIAIEVLDNQLHLLATTSSNQANIAQTGVSELVNSPVPWDIKAAQWILKHPFGKKGVRKYFHINAMYFSIDDHKPNHRLYVRNLRRSLLLT